MRRTRDIAQRGHMLLTTLLLNGLLVGGGWLICSVMGR